MLSVQYCPVCVLYFTEQYCTELHCNVLHTERHKLLVFYPFLSLLCSLCTCGNTVLPLAACTRLLPFLPDVPCSLNVFSLNLSTGKRALKVSREAARIAVAERVSEARKVLATARVSGESAFLSARNSGGAALLSACTSAEAAVKQAASASQKSLASAYEIVKAKLPEEVGHTTDKALQAIASATAWIWVHLRMVALYLWGLLKLLWST